MKKLLVLSVVAVLAVSLLVGCAHHNKNAPKVPANPSQSQNVQPQESAPDVSQNVSVSEPDSEPASDSSPLPSESVKPQGNKPAEKPSENPAEKPSKKQPEKVDVPVSSRPVSSSSVPEVKVSREEAKAAALKHAGLSENEISRYKAELDRERAGLVYEIEFDAGKYEYEYEVSAEDGKVLKSQKEFRD